MEPTVFYLFHDATNQWLTNVEGETSEFITDAMEFESEQQADDYSEAHDGDYMVLGWYQ